MEEGSPPFLLEMGGEEHHTVWKVLLSLDFPILSGFPERKVHKGQKMPTRGGILLQLKTKASISLQVEVSPLSPQGPTPAGPRASLRHSAHLGSSAHLSSLHSHCCHHTTRMEHSTWMCAHTSERRYFLLPV